MENYDKLLEQFVTPNYIKQGLQNRNAREKLIRSLLTHKKLPESGWTDSVIEHFLNQLATMDSNNFSSNCGVGEREGRVFSPLVKKRHFNLSHGIGRSGDIAEVQPKAAGSSVLYKLTNALVGEAMSIAGFKNGYHYLTLPMATGMSLVLCLIALKKQNPESEYVIWPRIDQKSCFKAISTAGLKPLVVENVMAENGELLTNTDSIRDLLNEHGSKVLCVLTTTSCFAPRQPDSIDKVAELCKLNAVGHIINNAYGIQCSITCKMINRAIVVGKVDAVIQSTDKNFMVPVGGAVVMSPDQAFIESISSSYPGRASMGPVLDLFITLLSMGRKGYTNLLHERVRLLPILRNGMELVAGKYNLSLIAAHRNNISIGLRLDALECGGSAGNQDRAKSLTFLGSILFQRSVSGCRVVPSSTAVKSVAGYDFMSWGAHMNAYPHSYLTAACSIGVSELDIKLFIDRLDKGITHYLKKTSNTIPISLPSSENTNNESAQELTS